MKKCPKCNTAFALTEFYKNAGRKDGLQQWCKGCVKKRDAVRHRPYNPEKQKRYAERRAKYHQNVNRLPEVLERRRSVTRAHYEANKPAYFARAMARMSRMKISSIIHDDPKNVAAVYAEAAKLRHEGHNVEVDHIVPLNGKTVSGLHVSWNLQIIPTIDNRRKGNKIEEHK